MTSQSVVVSFAHFDARGVVAPYVVRYVEALHALGAVILFTSTSPSLTPDSVDSIRGFCAGGVYLRPNVGYDFGSHCYALSMIKQHGWELEKFDRLVLANDSVYAPLFPLEEMWGTFEGADMYGAIESSAYKPHLQSFFVAFDLNSRTIRFLDEFWGKFEYGTDLAYTIPRYEIGLSAAAREAGLVLQPFISAVAAEEAYERSPGHWSAPYRDGTPPNETILFWDGLIEELRFPFLKTRVARGPSLVLPDGSRILTPFPQIREIVERCTGYPWGLIESNVAACGN